MVESNKPVNSTNNSQVWEGMAIGAGAGAGITGMTMGAAYGKHGFNNFLRDKSRNYALNKAKENPKFAGKADDQIWKELYIKGNRVSDDAAFEMHQSKTMHSRMGGGWKRAGIVAGMTALGAGAGAGIGYYNQKN